MKEELLKIGFVSGKIDPDRLHYSIENGNTIVWHEKTGTISIHEHGILRGELQNATLQMILNILNSLQ